MRKGKIREFIEPTGVSQLSSIFLAIARAALLISLLFADPLSSGFGKILILLFFVSVARHFLIYFSGPMPDNIYNFFLDLVTPCLYGFLLYHIFSIYEADFLLLAVSVFLPAILYCVLFMREPGQGMGKRTFSGGLFCYALSFFLAINYSFDTSGPVVEQYFLAKKYAASTSYDGEASGGDVYYFDLINIDSISASTQWVEIDPKACKRYHNSWLYKTIKLDNATFMILDKKTPPNLMYHQCNFLLQETKGPMQTSVITEQQYARFEKGDTFHIEKHPGLLGIEWVTYR